MSNTITTSAIARLYAKHGSLKAIARAGVGVDRETIRRMYHQAMAEGKIGKIKLGGKSNAHYGAAVKGKLQAPKSRPVIAGRKRALKAKKVERHPELVTRFLFTCAQNNTLIHEPVWKGLMALKDYYNAQFHISRFAYVKAGLGARGDKKKYFANVMPDPNASKDFWFDERLEPYFSDDRLEIAPGLVWCGEANILPTAARPLSSLENFTGRASAIFPHVKIAMESIAASETDPVKFNYTTGTVTQRNYIQRKEGLKAEFHHCYGALLVEVEPDGSWWCRQINADSEGTLYDIDIQVKDGVVTHRDDLGHSIVEGVKWGDIHRKQIDEKVKDAIWGLGGILDHLHPKYQFMDDMFDMFARNHHEMDDPHTMLSRYLTGDDSVQAEALQAGEFVEVDAHRPWLETVIVNSNHDRAIMRWLKDRRAQFDPPNFAFWHRMNDRVAQYMVANGGQTPIILQEALLEAWGYNKAPKGITFLKQGATFVICPTKGGGVDNGQHGDDGANGARGTTVGFSKLGRKMNKGHDHRATIMDSVYSTGCCLDLKNPPSYQRGPSSASNSHVVTYINAKRQILTQWGPERKAWADR